MEFFRLKRDAMTSQVLVEDSGSALVLALVFMLFVSLAVISLLTLTETSFLTTQRIDAQSKINYALDTAVKEAVDRIRKDEGNNGWGRFGVTCPNYTTADGSITVTCTPGEMSGVDLGNNNPDNRPPYAILALSQDDPAINQGSNSKNLVVNGDVAAKAKIAGSVRKSVFQVLGDVTAPSCDSNVRATNVKNCAWTGTPTLDLTPAQTAKFLYNASSPPARAAAPDTTDCTKTGTRVIRFFPGRYTSDPFGLIGTTGKTPQSCDSSSTIYWFTPGTSATDGVYYMDFDSAWAINVAGIIIGGTPTSQYDAALSPGSNWNATNYPFPTIEVVGGQVTKPPLGSRCNAITNNTSTIDGTGITNHGVQFIFAGEGRMQMQGGSFEMCAEPFASQQRIAVYSSKGVQNVSRSKPSNASNVVNFLPANGSAALDVEETPVATTEIGTLTSAIKKSSITLSGFSAPPAPNPTLVLLKIRHSETGQTQAISYVSATVTSNGTSRTFVSGSSCGSIPNCTNNKLSLFGTLSYDAVDVSDLLDTDAKVTSATVSYSVIGSGANNKVATAVLDGIVFDVTTGYRVQSGCVTNAGSGTQCDLVSTSGNNFKGMVIHGTVYAPDASLNVQITNEVDHTFRRGMVVRRITFGKTASSRVFSPAVSLPPFGTGRTPREVLLTAQINSGPDAGKPQLRAWVKFIDKNDDGTENFGRKTEVISWSRLRPEAVR